MDHQRHLLRLLRHSLQIRQRLHRPPHRTRLQRGNQTHQNLLLHSSRNNLHRIQQRQSPQTQHSRSRTRRFPSHYVQLVPLPSPLFPPLTNTPLSSQQPRTLHDVRNGNPLVPHDPRRMSQMVSPTPRLLQTPNPATRHPPQTRLHDLQSRSLTILDRIFSLPNEPFILLCTSKTPLGPDCAL